MYYLVVNTNQLKIVDSFESHKHRNLILRNYCIKNNIALVKNRQQINEQCRDNGLYAYKLNDYDYIVLDCIYHPSTFMFNGYVEKKTVYHLNFVYFVKDDQSVINVVKDIISFDKKSLK